MKNKENRPEEDAVLRRRAEELAQENAAQSPQDLAFLSPEESNNTLHELRVHQIELEMQNEELRRTQIELKTARERYFNLYDLAPVGYVTLSEQGLILEANLTATGLLGVERGTLVKQPLSRFIVKEDQDNHYLHRKQLFESGEAQNYDLRMLRKDGQVFWVHLVATAVPDEEGTRLCSAVISDITDSKQAEEALRESELRFRTLADSGQAMVWTSGLDKRFDYLNQPWLDFTGRTLVQELGYGWKEGVHPDDLARCVATYVGAFDRLECFSIDYRHRRHDGKFRWMQDNGSPRYDSLGVFLGFIGHCLDITERKQSEENRSDSELFFLTIINSLKGHICVLDETGKIVLTNQAWDDFAIANSADPQYVSEGVNYLSVCDSVTGPDLESASSCSRGIRAVLSGDSPDFNMEYPCHSPTKKRWFLGKVSPLQNKDSRWVVINHENISERKQAEEALRESEAKFRQMFDISPVGIVMVDLDKRFIFCNSAFLQSLGYGMEELVGKLIEDVTLPEDSQIGMAEMMAIMKGEIAKSQVQKRYIRKDGQVIWGELTNSIIRDSEGRAEYFLAIIQDITKRKLAEKELQNSLKKTQKILDNLQDGFIQADQTGNIVFINPAVTKMFGYNKSEEMIGKPALTLYADAKERDGLIETLKEAGIINEFTTKGLRKDGSTFWASVNVRFNRNEAGEINGTEGEIRDISERIKSTEEIEHHRNVLDLRLNQTVNAISKIGELRDAYTAGHQKRVSELACAIASKMGLPDEKIHNLSFGGLIHDIGKFMIPSDILNKPSKISDLEYKLIQTHVEESYKVVKEIDFPVEIHTMVYQHHERLDGSGYPQGLSGDEIILESRILGVADVIEAMSSHRPYRAALGIDTALEEILLHRGTKYDAEVVDVCIKLIKEDGYVL